MNRPQTMTDHLMAAVEANPQDQATRSALADHLMEDGIPGGERLAALTHDWDDESYHGSPDWVCKDCRAAEWMEKRDGRKTCPNAVAAVIRSVRAWLDKEWWEWKRLREAEDRKRELVRRWGDF